MWVPSSEWNNKEADEDYTPTWITPYGFSSVFSSVGSAWIIVEILLNRRKRSMCYHRILLGMSIFDFFSSLWFFIGIWAQPNTSGHEDGTFTVTPRRYASGNQTACDMSGFSIYLCSLAIPLYHLALVVYYYLVTCKKWTEEKVKGKFERSFYLFTAPTILAIAIIPIFLKLYNPWYSYCFVVWSAKRAQTGYKNLFSNNQTQLPEDQVDEYMEMTANERINADIFQLLSVATMLLCCCTIAMILLLFLLKKFAQRWSASDNSSISSNGFSSGVGLWSSSTLGDIEEVLQEYQEKRNQADENLSTGLRMALYYSIVYSLTWVLPFSFMFLVQVQNRSREFSFTQNKSMAIYVIDLYLAIFLPLRGFLNCIVYLIPRYQHIRKEGTSSCCLTIMLDTLFWSCRSRRRMTSLARKEDCFLGTCAQEEEAFNNDNQIANTAGRAIRSNATSSNGDEISENDIIYISDQTIIVHKNDESLSDVSCSAPSTSYMVDGLDNAQ